MGPNKSLIYKFKEIHTLPRHYILEIIMYILKNLGLFKIRNDYIKFRGQLTKYYFISSKTKKSNHGVSCRFFSIETDQPKPSTIIFSSAFCPCLCEMKNMVLIGWQFLKLKMSILPVDR